LVESQAWPESLKCYSLELRRPLASCLIPSLA
jgi:hypothetical protein